MKMMFVLSVIDALQIFRSYSCSLGSSFVQNPRNLCLLPEFSTSHLGKLTKSQTDTKIKCMLSYNAQVTYSTSRYCPLCYHPTIGNIGIAFYTS